MKNKTCKYCGKPIDSFGFEVEPIHDVPEMNKKSFFCSKSCFHRFVGGIKSSRKKTAKAALRAKLLHKKSCSMTKTEIEEIQAVLTSKEKSALEIISITWLLKEFDYNIGLFFKDLHRYTGEKDFLW